MPDFQQQPSMEPPQQDVASESPGMMGSLAALAAPITGAGAAGLQGLLGNQGVSGLLGGGGSLLRDLGPMLGTGGTPEMHEDIANGIGDLMAWGSNKLSDAGGWLEEHVSSAGSWLTEKADGLGSWLGEQWEGAKSVAGEAWDALSGWAGEKWDGAKQWMGDLWNGVGQEGLGGLLDPSGMMDRQDAQRELRGNFDIVPDDFVGPRNQNQVTQAEFEEIARTYSDIRLGRSDLKLDTAGLSEEDAAAFRAGTMSDIGNLLQTQSGRGLVRSLAYAPLQADGTSRRTTTISRRNDASGNADPSNANGGGTFGQSGYARYVPGVDTLASRENLRSDVTLYHELVHAHHAVYNTWDSGNVAAGPGVPASDVGVIGNFEHQAAGIGAHANDAYSENRYRAERRMIGNGVGARTTGSETDANMTRRDTYAWTGPRTNPATMPGNPSTAGPSGTRTMPGSGGAGDASRIGRSTDDEHHHDHDHDHDHHH